MTVKVSREFLFFSERLSKETFPPSRTFCFSKCLEALSSIYHPKFKNHQRTFKPFLSSPLTLMALEECLRFLEVPFPIVLPPQILLSLPNFTRSAPGHREAETVCSGLPILKQWFDSWVQLLVFNKNRIKILSNTKILISLLLLSTEKKEKAVSDYLNELSKMPLLSSDTCPLAYNSNFGARSIAEIEIFNMLGKKEKPHYASY